MKLICIFAKLKTLSLFLKNKSGIISIEVAIIFPFFIALFLFVLEISRVMFIGSALDLVSSQVGRETTISENLGENSISYTELYEQLLEKEIPGWTVLASKDNFKISVKFCNSAKDVINNQCSTGMTVASRILLFDINYHYSAIFPELFSQIIDASLTKKIVVYREFYS